jgi:hypothetical protein
MKCGYLGILTFKILKLRNFGTYELLPGNFVIMSFDLKNFYLGILLLRTWILEILAFKNFDKRSNATD